jgi:hypothetical protein
LAANAIIARAVSAIGTMAGRAASPPTVSLGRDRPGCCHFGGYRTSEARLSVLSALSTFHPEIAKPADLLPDEEGCAAAMASAPQLLFTNAAVASAMLGSFYAWREGHLRWEEVYLDLAVGRQNPVTRNVATGDADEVAGVTADGMADARRV